MQSSIAATVGRRISSGGVIDSRTRGAKLNPQRRSGTSWQSAASTIAADFQALYAAAGPVLVTIPADTQSVSLPRLRGKDLPLFGGGQRDGNCSVLSVPSLDAHLVSARLARLRWHVGDLLVDGRQPDRPGYVATCAPSPAIGSPRAIALLDGCSRRFQ